LKIKDRVIGVLDVQSTQASAFTKEDIDILQILADQLSLSIENARLFSESQQAYLELQAQLGMQSRQSWLRINQNEKLIFSYDPSGVKSSHKAIAAYEFPSDQSVRIPIELHGKKLGTVVLRREPDAPPWTLDEQGLMRTCLSQVALALENARLVDETRHRAVREEILNQLTTSFSRSLDMDSVLQVAVQELGSLPTVLEASVHINPPDEGLVMNLDHSSPPFHASDNGHGEKKVQ
jgi:GAF domain-containing protein